MQIWVCPASALNCNLSATLQVFSRLGLHVKASELCASLIGLANFQFNLNLRKFCGLKLFYFPLGVDWLPCNGSLISGRILSRNWNLLSSYRFRSFVFAVVVARLTKHDMELKSQQARANIWSPLGAYQCEQLWLNKPEHFLNKSKLHEWSGAIYVSFLALR